MSLNATTLSGAISADATQVTLASGTGAAVGKFLKVDSEMLLVQNIDNSPVLKVMRGVAGTAAVAHATDAIAVLGLGSDFPPIPAPRQYTYDAAGAITVAPGLHVLNSGAADAMTLDDPSLGDDGMELSIVAATAHAYTVAGTFNAGGGGADLETLGGAVGDGFTVVARGGKWLVVSSKNATIS